MSDWLEIFKLFFIRRVRFADNEDLILKLLVVE